MAKKLKSKGCGISIADGIKLCCLFYVDDIVIFGDNEEQLQKLDLQQAPTLRKYRLCKREMQTEIYLRVRLNQQQRSMLCQLRCGILSFRI